MRSDFSDLKNEFEIFRNFISTQVSKALKVLMDRYNVASGNTNQPCGFILKRIHDVEQKTESILNKFNAGTTFASTTKTTTMPWEGGFANIFSATNITSAGSTPARREPSRDISELQESEYIL